MIFQDVHRHSGSPTCAVKLTQDEHGLRVEVKDSGRGIPKAKQLTLPSSGGVGLRGMQERIRQLGGTLEIDSSKNGTVAENLHGNWNIERGHVTPERIKGKAVEG